MAVLVHVAAGEKAGPKSTWISLPLWFSQFRALDFKGFQIVCRPST